MKVFHSFPSSHEEVIHDLCYDFYGKRLATCSSDQKIKVWDMNSEGKWHCSSEWKAHSGSIWKIAWAHPEFGQVLASCSVDRNVCIWEEQEGPSASTSGGSIGVRGPQSQWVNRASLVDSRESVTDIKFAPRHLGLKLAACSADGLVRIYEAIDVLNLTHWPLMEELESQNGACIAWNPSRFDAPMIVVGSGDNPRARQSTAGVVQLWQYNDTNRRWHVLLTLTGHTGPVHDVSWAPDMGRSYHLVASASKDKTVRIWKLQPPSDASSPLKILHATVLSDHTAEVWRVEWNITGTILASSSDDLTVRLWKSDLVGQWACLSVIRQR